jgi:sodium transport system permease protein
LLQKLIAAASFEQTPWLYFLPVLAPLVLYGWFALRWAIEQFKREEVLFREAERLDLGLWLRNLFRDKEALPSTGQAVFCFVLIVLLHWIGFGFGGRLPLLGRNGVAMLGFVATPTLLMALQLTTQPGRALGLRWPAPRSFLSAGLLAFLLLPLLSELTLRVLRSYPGLMELLADHNPLTAELRFLGSRTRSPIGWWEALQYLLILAVLPAACEELTFRGFILTGLRRRFSTGIAIVFSSLLFALYHFNVFQFVPAFLLGLILGLLAVRTGSILPGVLFHFIHNSTLLCMVILQGTGISEVELRGDHLLWPIGLVTCSLVALLVILRLAKQSVRNPAAGDEMGTIQDAPTTATAGLAAASGQR